MDLVLVAQVAQVIIQIATAITTVFLARWAYSQAKAAQQQAQATEETVNEMRESRLAQERPHIIVEADHSRPTFVYIVVRNIGKGAAKNITFEFSDPIESPQSADPTSVMRPLNEQPYFQRGMPFLAPGAEIRCLWGSMIDLAQFLRDRNLEDGITITSRYESLTGDSYETPWTVNPLLIADRVSLERDIQRDE
jgi:hypothetical protein